MEVYIILERNRLPCYALIVLLMTLYFGLFSTSVFAEFVDEAKQVNEPINNEPINNEGTRLDKKAIVIVDEVHDAVSNRVVSVSNYIDTFFANDRMDEEGSKSKIVLGYQLGYDDFRGGSKEYALRARLHLPRTEERLRLVIDSSENEDDSSETDANVQAGSEGRIDELKAALQYIFVSSELWQVSANTGIRFIIPLDPFAKLRIRRLFFVNSLTLRLTQSFYFFRSVGWGETTAIDFEKELTDKYFFRSSSQIRTIRDTSEKSFSHAFSLFQNIGQKKLVVYSVGINADLTSPPVTTQYYLNTRYRHNFYKKWAFYELIPGITLERENSFNVSPGFFVKLEIIFG